MNTINNNVNNINIQDSKIYIAIQGESSIFNEKAVTHIKNAFLEIFENSEKVSDVDVDEYREMVYSINTPVLQDNSLFKDFYSDLEIILYELKEYNPHFTQYRRVDDNAN